MNGATTKGIRGWPLGKPRPVEVTNKARETRKRNAEAKARGEVRQDGTMNQPRKH